MKSTKVMRTVEKTLRDNSPALLTAAGVSGAITTAYLTGKASYAAAIVIRDKEYYEARDFHDQLDFRERVELVWRLYIPAGISGVATVVFIVGASRVSSRRTAAVTVAYSLSERAFSEYRDKVIEKFGEGKEQAVRDEVAQDRVTNNPPQSIIVASGGDVLCCELFTGRYFKSDMETLRKAQNDINAKLISHSYASLDDFYYIIGIPPTSYSNNVGWSSDKMMSLEFSTVLTEDNKPCLAFEYNYTVPS